MIADNQNNMPPAHIYTSPVLSSSSRSGEPYSQLFYKTDNQTANTEYDPRLMDATVRIMMSNFFAAYADEWLNDTSWHSSISSITRHRRFRDIVNMGTAAAIFILARMNQGDIHIHWFPALKDIANEDPVPADERGSVPLMTKRWIDWGKRKGYFSA